LADLATNMDFKPGRVKCHRSLDLMLTPDGDLALTEDSDTESLQRLVIYMFTQKGERYNPNVGCILHHMIHAGLTATNLALIQRSIETDLNTLFPEFKGAEIRVAKMNGQTNTLAISFVLPQGAFGSIIDLDSLLSSSELMKDLIGDRYGRM